MTLNRSHDKRLFARRAVSVTLSEPSDDRFCAVSPGARYPGNAEPRTTGLSYTIHRCVQPLEHWGEQADHRSVLGKRHRGEPDGCNGKKGQLAPLPPKNKT
jgi:hypothetical protein